MSDLVITIMRGGLTDWIVPEQVEIGTPFVVKVQVPIDNHTPSNRVLITNPDRTLYMANEDPGLARQVRAHGLKRYFAAQWSREEGAKVLLSIGEPVPDEEW